ncbi:uncharacterized protein LOC126392676 [Epinephelus moara]|uniref:uncharacterized protein LOC126392676 n=1 Tax=Epinephelus moara TaxID=300413 RepID=UPI00214F42D5|nr:uncharacterized protein LOC126392676 [Epinephelus moara]
MPALPPVGTDTPSSSKPETLDLSNISPEYHDGSEVLSKQHGLSLPPHHPYYCGINLLPGAPLHTSPLYNLSCPERESMEKYIKESLAEDPAANTATADTSTPPTELKTEVPGQLDPSRIEVVSVTEEDLPTVETPNTLNVSPLGSFAADPESGGHPAKLEEPQPPAAPSLTMPITKVQPFIHEDDLEKSWKDRLLAHRSELLIASCLIVVVTLALGIGLGGPSHTVQCSQNI